MQKKIAIIGLGWVGLPLSKKLESNGYHVIGTSTRSNKVASSSNIHFLQLEEGNLATQEDVFNDFDVMIIAITPGFKRGATDYKDNVAALIEFAEQKQFKHVMLLSSSGVYTSLTGHVDESTALNSNIEKVAQLFTAEQKVLSFSGYSQVLRLAGLVGPNRYPGKFLAGKKDVSQANAPIHLIHQTDVVDIIYQFINTPHLEGTFNCVSPTLCQRKPFYVKAAQCLSLEAPTFLADDDKLEYKEIDSAKLKKALNYQFQYPDLFQWLDAGDNRHIAP